jgi:hypothetical protein
VGKDLVVYIDPMSVEDIAVGARQLIEDPPLRAHLEAKIANAPLRTWEDVARDLLQAVTPEAQENTPPAKEPARMKKSA